MCKISLIIPAYNVEKYIEKCLYSCINQQVSSSFFEIIVVNDGSTDDTEKKIDSFINTNSKFQIKLISQKNKGLSAARNTGLKHSVGDYVWFIDSDDWINVESLKKLKPLLESDYDAIAFGASTYIENKYVRYSDRTNFANQVLAGFEMFKYGLYQCAVPLTVYRRDFLLKNDLHMMVGVYHEDVEFSPRAYYIAENIYILNDILYYIRQTPESITRKPNPKKGFDLIKVACSLNTFLQQRVLKSHAAWFHSIIASSINSSLFNVNDMNSSQKENLSRLLYEKKYLINSFLLSRNIKYFIEGLLFKLSPTKIVSTYSILRSFV